MTKKTSKAPVKKTSTRAPRKLAATAKRSKAKPAKPAKPAKAKRNARPFSRKEFLGMNKLALKKKSPLARVRIGKNMSRAQLSEASGLSEECIRNIEIRGASAQLRTLQTLAKALSVPVTKLVA